MIYEILPTEIKVLYLKMQTSSNLQGFLDALAELLDELEFHDDTKKSFEYIRNLYSYEEELLKNQFKTTCNWLKDRLKELKSSPLINSKKIKNHIEKQYKHIKQGTISIFQGNSFIEMLFNLLETSTNMAAAYGYFDAIKSWTKNAYVKKSTCCFDDDPFLNKEIPNTILPNSDLGLQFEEKLNKGFIKADVILPNELFTRQEYQVHTGYIDFNYPLEIENSLMQVRWFTQQEDIKNQKPSMLLRELYFYAYWRGIKNIDLTFPEKTTDNDLNEFYNNSVSKGYLHLCFSLKENQENCRKNITKTLERFLIFILQEIKQRRDSEKAFRYAYRKVKEYLLSKDEIYRNSYIYDEIIEKITTQAKLEVLPFEVLPKYCRKACQRFRKIYGWKPIRKRSQKKMIAPTRSKF